MVPEIKDFEQRKEALIKKGKELGFITYEEIAEELNISQSEVSKRLFKLMEKIKQAFN